MNRTHIALGFGLVSLIAGAAFAAGGNGGPKGPCRGDADNDGKVTLAEALATGANRFQQKDANKDGVITKDEMPGRMQRMLEKADANKDGKISAQEHEAMVRENFTRRDTNKDGVLSGDERGGNRGRGRQKT